MATETEVAISITPDGKRMKREEVVEYLKTLSEHIVMEIQLEEHISKLRKKLADITRQIDLSHVLPPEPMPPVAEHFPVISIVVVVLGAIFGLFYGQNLEEKCLISGVPSALLILSFLWNKRKNQCAMEDWLERKRLYDEEAERVASLNSTATREDSQEVLAVKQKLQRAEDDYRKVQASKQFQENRNILAVDYRKGMIPCVLYGFFFDGRANTLSEALNLFHVEMHQQNQMQEQKRMREEIIMHQNAILQQQNLNAARLSGQIENAKNELEFDILLDSLYTSSQIEALRRDLGL